MYYLFVTNINMNINDINIELKKIFNKFAYYKKNLKKILYL